ncbi:MAG: RNA methyltransferase [Chloroflexi bacterium]|nr:RNA methyltransferase [Chloroflexota bacterium]
MSYNQTLAKRLREILDDGPAYIGNKTFGGVGFILNENMAVSVNQHNLIVRFGKEGDASVLSQPHAHSFDFTDKLMQGGIYVSPQG